MKRGVHAILYAFFDENEALDRSAMRRQVEICSGAGVAGIAALGLATEVAKLTFAERCTVMDWVASDTAGRVPLGFTIYGQSVAEQIAMVRHAEKNKADWIILQPPQVGSYDAGEYLDFFGRVMNATALPVAIQNAPQYLGRGLSDGDISRLRDRHANFKLIKSESSAADAKKLVAMAGLDFKVFNGRGGLELLACLAAGCEGFLLAPDLIDLSTKVMKFHDAGDIKGAERLYHRIAPAITYIMSSIEHFICYGKRLFAMRSGLDVYDRAPALRTTKDGLKMIQAFSDDLGVFTRNELP
jgi:2-keto-3-deoxy-L-arabinonate dehydratase